MLPAEVSKVCLSAAHTAEKTQAPLLKAAALMLARRQTALEAMMCSCR